MAGKCGSGKQDITAAIWKKLLSKAIKAKSKNEAGEISALFSLCREGMLVVRTMKSWRSKQPKVRMYCMERELP